MKKFLLLLFTFISFNTFAQIQVKEGSFHIIDGYVMMDKEDHIDMNNAPMALIKISTENITAEERRRITFKGNLATYFDVQFEPSEIYLYITAKSATFIEIHHPDYGKTEYWLPETLCDYCGYEMVVQYVPLKPKLDFATIVVDSEPAGADIYIDGELVGKTPNIFKEIEAGRHELKLEKQEYNSLTRIFIVDEGEKLSFNETLSSVYYKASTQETTQIQSQNEKKNATRAPMENQVFTVNGVSFTMIAVESGTFQMGASQEQLDKADIDESPSHSVTLDDYYIGETEVTQELWEAVMGKNRSKFKSLQRPVERVSWNDCQEFISKLNALTGKNFRLPTEAEWEYAARGGNKSKGYKYSGSNMIEDVAWYKNNSSSQTHDVKTKQANELGIYDMSGNVLEWCLDWYGVYSSAPQNNPIGQSSGFYRVLRGGNWNDYSRYCRVSCRDYINPGGWDATSGFRLALQEIQ